MAMITARIPATRHGSGPLKRDRDGDGKGDADEQGTDHHPEIDPGPAGLKPGDCLEFILQGDGTVVMVPATAPVADLYGCLPPPAKAVSLDCVEQAIRRRGGRS